MDVRRKKTSLELRWPNAPRVAGVSLAVARVLLMVGLTGCAIHYSDRRTGTEHLWGLGQMQSSRSNNCEFATIVTGYRVPGLCLEIGRDHFGLTLGYLNRQQLAVVNTNATDAIQPPHATPPFLSRGITNGLWGFGHLRMRALPSSNHYYAIITGKAMAGFCAGAGGGDTALSLALDSRQAAVVLDENVHLEFDQDAPRWPGLDLFNTQVTEVGTSESIHQTTN